MYDVLDKTELNRLNYINNEQKVNSDFRAQNISGVDKALLPVIEEKKYKQIERGKKTPKQNKKEKKKGNEKKGSNIDYEG